MRRTRVILAAAHLDHDPSNNRLRNLKSPCQRCHMIHNRPHHLARRRIAYLLRRALGDLFLGPYSAYFGAKGTALSPGRSACRATSRYDRLLAAPRLSRPSIAPGGTRSSKSR